MTWLLGLFLAAHGLIHASFVSPRPPENGGPQWPFNLDASWLLGSGVRPLGLLLVAVSVIAFLLAGASTLGILVPPAWWGGLVVAGSVAGLLLLALFFHPWLSLGILLNAALLLAVLQFGWKLVPA
ncbi:MAG TPA: hypothetical protein VNT60_00470 [Deinococcales bacterium]|nr:hypothetical protein [Deinococcales bacterium]